MKKITILIFSIVLFSITLLFLKNEKKESDSQKVIPIQFFTNSYGTKTYFVPTEGIPIIDIRVSFDAGSARDTKPGLAALCSALIDEGSLSIPANVIAKSFENNGAIYTAKIDQDKMSFSVRALTSQQLIPIVQLFGLILKEPAFEKKSVELIKNRILMRIQKRKQSPKIIAEESFYQLIYNHHPYANPVYGTLEGIASIHSEDLRQFHQQFIVSKNAHITIVGNLNLSKAKEISDILMSGLQEGYPAPPLPEVPPLNASKHIHINYPSTQSHIIWGCPLRQANDPDFFALILGNYILGETPLVSRLFKEIREKKGFAYSVNSAMYRLKKPAPFMITLQTQNNQSSKAIEVLKDTLIQFIKQGPTGEELLLAKHGLIGEFPLNIANNAKILKIVSEMAFYDLPIDFLDSYRSNIQKVTKEEVQRVLQERIHPDKMSFVVVGG